MRDRAHSLSIVSALLLTSKPQIALFIAISIFTPLLSAAVKENVDNSAHHLNCTVIPVIIYEVLSSSRRRFRLAKW